MKRRDFVALTGSLIGSLIPGCLQKRNDIKSNRFGYENDTYVDLPYRTNGGLEFFKDIKIINKDKKGHIIGFRFRDADRNKDILMRNLSVQKTSTKRLDNITLAAGKYEITAELMNAGKDTELLEVTNNVTGLIIVINEGSLEVKTVERKRLQTGGGNIVAVEVQNPPEGAGIITFENEDIPSQIKTVIKRHSTCQGLKNELDYCHNFSNEQSNETSIRLEKREFDSVMDRIQKLDPYLGDNGQSGVYIEYKDRIYVVYGSTLAG